MKKRFTLFLLLATLIIWTAACTDTDKSKPPVPPEPADTYVITSLSASPTETMMGGQIVITAQATKNGQPLDGESIAFSASTGGVFVESNASSISKMASNGTSQVTLTSSTVGTVSVTASTHGAAKSITVTFSEDVFIVTAIEPNSGSANGGDTVTIKGMGFDPTNTVFFGTSAAQIVDESSSTQLIVTTPSFALTDPTQDQTVDVIVTRRVSTDQEEAYTVTSGFTFLHTVEIPEITGVDPTMGPNDGQTEVTILGSGFDCGHVQVFFNTTPAAVLNCEPDKLIVSSPNAYDMGITNCNEDVTIKVVNTLFGTEGTWCCFHYGEAPLITSIAPSQGLYTGGTKVTIYGHGFDEPVAVGLAGVAAQPVSVSETEVVVLSGAADVTSCSDVTGKVSITNIECGASAETSGNAWTYKVPPIIITGISPGTAVEGTIISIFGQNFVAPMRAGFGSVEVPATTISSGEIQAPAPVFSGNYDTQDCVDADGCSGTQNINTPVDISVKSMITGCSDSLQNAFFYIPTDTSCQVEPPTCSFTYTPSSPTAGNPVNFTDGSGACPVNWSWTFGDGNTSNVQSPSNTYAVAGTYTVTLTVSNSGGNATCSQSVTVNP